MKDVLEIYVSSTTTITMPEIVINMIDEDTFVWCMSKVLNALDNCDIGMAMTLINQVTQLMCYHRFSGYDRDIARYSITTLNSIIHNNMWSMNTVTVRAQVMNMITATKVDMSMRHAFPFMHRQF